MSRRSRISLSAITLMAALAAPLAARAQQADVPSRLEEIEQAQRILARQVELAHESEVEAAKTQPVVSVGDKGFGLKTADGAFALRIRGLLQVDGRSFPSDDALPLTDTFLVRRARPILEATFLNLIDLRLTPDFGDAKVQLVDAYLDVRPFPWLKLRAGKFKPALGLERLQSDENLVFMERATPSSLLPNRDIGLQLQGDVLKGTFQYALGVFNGVPDGALGDNDINENKEVLGRLFVHPFRPLNIEALNHLGLGFGASFGRQTGALASQQLPSFKSGGQQTFFSYATDAIANGNRTRYSPQAYFYVGPIGVTAEYVSSSQTVTRGANTAILTHTAWQATVNWVVTGENASFDGVVPRQGFAFDGHHFGAFEIGARVNVLRVDDSAFPLFADTTKTARRATAGAVALNWYFNRNARVSLNFERTWFIGGAAQGDRPEENALFGRIQVVF